MLRFCPVLIAALFGATPARARPAPPIPVVTLTAGIRISRACRIARGVYRLHDPGGGMTQISASKGTVDFSGASIVGDGNGSGITVTGAHDLTIRNARITGCRWGIVLTHCRGVRLVGCVASVNGNLPPGTVIDESGRQPEDEHGGGILIRDSERCSVQGCVAQYQWDGIDVVRSTGNVITRNDLSFNGNWGVHFWDSSGNVFGHNRAVWCTTGGGLLYQALSGWQTYDAQAVGIDHNSNANLIEDNDLRFGGDGIYIRANEGPITPGTVVPPRNGSNRNILRGNDCSFSPNNAVEADLVDGTVVEGNDCSHSNYGLWLGYSRGSLVRNNTCVDDSTRAMEIENGQNGTFERNVFGYAEFRPDAELVYLRQNGRDQTPSGPYTIRDNLFYGAETGVLLRNTAALLTGNTLERGPGTRPQLVRGDPLSRITQAQNSFATRAADTTAAANDTRNRGWSGLAAPDVPGHPGAPRITAIRNHPRTGGTMTIDGTGLSGTVLLNGRPLPVLSRTALQLTVALPAGQAPPGRYNLVIETGAGLSLARSMPVPITVR